MHRWLECILLTNMYYVTSRDSTDQPIPLAVLNKNQTYYEEEGGGRVRRITVSCGNMRIIIG